MSACTTMEARSFRDHEDDSFIGRQVENTISQLAGVPETELGSAQNTNVAETKKGLLDRSPCVDSEEQEYPCVKKYVQPVVTAFNKGETFMKAETLAVRKRDKRMARQKQLRSQVRAVREKERKKRTFERKEKKVAASAESKQQLATLGAMQHEALKYTKRVADLKARLMQSRANLDTLRVRMRASTKATPTKLQGWKDTVARMRIDMNRDEKAMAEAKKQAVAVNQRASLMRSKINKERGQKLKVQNKQQKHLLDKAKAQNIRAWEQPPSRFLTKLKAKEKRDGLRIVRHARRETKVRLLNASSKKVADLATATLEQQAKLSSLKMAKPSSSQVMKAKLKLVMLNTEKKREEALAAKTGQAVAKIEKEQEASIRANVREMKLTLPAVLGPTGDKVRDEPRWLKALAHEARKSTAHAIDTAAQNNKNVAMINKARIQSMKADSKEVFNAVSDATVN